MLNLRQIEVFRAVMTTKSVSGAARMLNCSQPGVSRLLKHTESRLGFALFERGAGGMIPTREAERIFREVQAIYGVMNDLDGLLERIRTGESHEFKLGASPSLSNHMIPAILRKLVDQFPELRIQFDVLPVDEISDYLVRERGEYALSVFDVSHPNIESRIIGRGRLVAALPPGHRLADRTVISAHDLAGERIIGLREASPHGQLARDLMADVEPGLNRATTVRFAETACAFVRQGHGIALVDEFTIRGFPSDELVIVGFDRKLTMPVYLHRGKFAPRSKIGRRFEELTEEFVANHPMD